MNLHSNEPLAAGLLELSGDPGELHVPEGGYLLQTDARLLYIEPTSPSLGAAKSEAASGLGKTIWCGCTEDTLRALVTGRSVLAEAMAQGRFVFSGPPDSFFHLMALVRWWRLRGPELPIHTLSREVWSPERSVQVRPDIFCSGILSFISSLSFDEDGLAAEIGGRLNRLLGSTLAASALYRALCGPAVPSAANTWLQSDLLRLPKTSKNDVTLLNREFSFSVDGGHVRLNTSGTTGRPCFVYRTLDDYWMGFYRYLAILYQNRFDALPTIYFPNPRLKVCEIFGRTGLIQMADAALPAQTHVLNIETCRASVIYSFPLFLQRILDELQKQKRPLEFVEHLVTVGDFMDAATRRQCAELFPNATITTTYGSTETGLMAYECKETGEYHVLAPDFVLTVERSDGMHSEGEGRLLVTKLCRGGTPLINYDVGDDVVLSRGVCRCGEIRPRFKYLGRSQDRTPLDNGVVLNASLVNESIGAIPEIHRFVCTWVEQTGELRVLAVPRLASDPEIRARIAQRLQLDELRVNLEWVEKLPETTGSKRSIFSVLRGHE
ncbi:AMP-binding protein [Burkholderia cepacia]|uniref:AMP-binding protein n=1 Tax=Burkholderia cepacia TaxID=292 RepID=UPI001CF25CC3|nr:AMP-binding protein [Burkholderia cepacia]MCA8350743.1 AMP-binding protein [Burkholderia cepacia]